MKRRIVTIIIALTALLLTGCGGGTQRPWGTLKECEQENTELSLQIQILREQNTLLTEQVTTLSALDSNARFEAINTLDKVRIGKRTGFYDKDNDGANETLVVYLEPLDTAQDYVKAVGKVNIELWDLNAAQNKAKLAEWAIEPAELHQTWGGNVFAGYYRLSIPMDDIFTKKHEELTVRVTFTDYLSGKVLTDQKAIIAKNYNWR